MESWDELRETAGTHRAERLYKSETEGEDLLKKRKEM